MIFVGLYSIIILQCTVQNNLKIHTFTNSMWNKEEIPEQSESIIVLSIGRLITQTVVIIGAYHICQLRTKFYPTSCCQS